MTFDSVTPHHCFSEDTFATNETYVPRESKKPKKTQPKQKESADDYCNESQISNWEDEGGAHFDCPGSFHRNDSLNQASKLTSHINKAESMIDAGEYEAAYEELKAAMERFVGYKNKIQGSFDRSISKLSSLGSAASPPHPVALPLVKLRQKFSS